MEIEETGTPRFDGELEFARGCGGRCVGRDEGILVSTLFKTTGVGAVADLVFQLPSRVGGERFSQGLNMDESDISCASPMFEDRRRNGRSGGGKKVGGPMGCVRTKSKRRRSRGLIKSDNVTSSSHVGSPTDKYNGIQKELQTRAILENRALSY